MQRFLIIQTAFIGDVILATPVITALKEKFPNCEIDFLLRKGNEEILENNPYINKVFALDKKNKWKSIFSLIIEFRRKKYTEIINLHRFASSGFISICSGSSKLSGFKKNPFSIFYSNSYEHKFNKLIHEVDRNLLCISHLTKCTNIRPTLFPSTKDFEALEKFYNLPYVCIFPASVWFTKQLPENKWVELCNLLKNRINVFILGSKNDFNLCENIKLKVNSNNCENLSGKLSILQVAALVKKAKMNFVNDSGPLHIASSMNANCTAFFCSTSTEFGFTPLSDISLIAEKTPKPSCKPCGLHGFSKCPKKHFDCGDIDIKELFAKIEKFL